MPDVAKTKPSAGSGKAPSASQSPRPSIPAPATGLTPAGAAGMQGTHGNTYVKNLFRDQGAGPSRPMSDLFPLPIELRPDLLKGLPPLPTSGGEDQTGEELAERFLQGLPGKDPPGEDPKEGEGSDPEYLGPPFHGFDLRTLLREFVDQLKAVNQAQLTRPQGVQDLHAELLGQAERQMQVYSGKEGYKKAVSHVSKALLKALTETASVKRIEKQMAAWADANKDWLIPTGSVALAGAVGASLGLGYGKGNWAPMDFTLNNALTLINPTIPLDDGWALQLGFLSSEAIGDESNRDLTLGIRPHFGFTYTFDSGTKVEVDFNVNVRIPVVDGAALEPDYSPMGTIKINF